MLAVNLFLPVFLGNYSSLHPIFNITYHFKDLAIFSTFDTKCQETTEYILSKIEQQEHTAAMVFTKNSSVIFRQTLSLPFLLLAVLPVDIFKTLNILEGSLERFQDIKIIFVFVEVWGNPSDRLNDLFSWCWKTGAFSVAAMFLESSGKIYSVNPFPNPEIVSVSPSMIGDLLFVDKTKDYKGAVLRRALVNDFPRSYTYTNDEGKVVIVGYNPTFVSEFIHHMNATMVDILNKDGSLMNIFEAENSISEGRADIATLIRNSICRDNIMFSLPIMRSLYSFLVPFSKSVPPSAYITLPFHLDVWVLVLIIIIFISSAEYLHNRILQSSNDFVRVLYNTMLGIASQSIPQDSFTSWRYRYIRIQLITVGFILTNLYLAHLSSFMTTQVYEPQLKSYKDIRDRGQKLLAVNYHFQYYEQRNLTPDYHHEIVIIINSETYLDIIFTMNGTYGFGLPEEEKELIELYQHNLKRPVFYDPLLYFPVPIAGTLVRKNSTFLIHLNNYILNLWASGLLNYWKKVNSLETIRLKFKTKVEVTERTEKLSLKHIEFISKFLCFGLTLATLCFLMELLVVYMKRQLRCNLTESE
ncbi:unnamed protein product [Hermetia illucens]|uniref:Ionotropic receptor n=1 Tax=Hermetia illucens TaxID=343691 RepID=A0A7R8V058_HERIL|nr:uncharacterized protein LOC119657071 [Hermetia illucens]CAD7090371.1 unnamed protein product [Hermetia illucens]